MDTVEDEVAAAKVGDGAEWRVSPHHEHAGMGRAGAMWGVIGWHAQYHRLSGVNGLQRPTADLGECCVRLDPRGHWFDREVQRRGKAHNTKSLRLGPDRPPKSGIPGLHLRQVVHRQAGLLHQKAARGARPVDMDAGRMACAPAVQNRKHPSTSWQHIVRMVPTGTGRVYAVSRHFPDTSLGAVVARHRRQCEFAVCCSVRPRRWANAGAGRGSLPHASRSAWRLLREGQTREAHLALGHLNCYPDGVSAARRPLSRSTRSSGSLCAMVIRCPATLRPARSFGAVVSPALGGTRPRPRRRA